MRRMIRLPVMMLALLTVGETKTGGEVTRYRTAYACEGRQLRITCEGGHMIQLLRANYGRFSISICNEHGNLDWSVDCTSPRSFYVIQESCGMKNSCSLSASPASFGDPCPGTPKYLEAHYQCVPEWSSAAPPTSTTASTSSSTSTSRPPIIIPVTRHVRPQPSSAATDGPPATSTQLLGDVTEHVTTEVVTTTSMAITTTLGNVLSGTPESSTSEPSTVHLSRWSPGNHEDIPPAMQACPPTQAKGLFWNWTRAGQVALHNCPGGAMGRAKWRCDSATAQWVPDSPDLSDCSSMWVENFKDRMARGDPVTSLAAELAVITRTKHLKPGDIMHTASILHKLVAEMAERTRDMEDPQQRQSLLLAFLEAVLEVSSNLLEDSVRLPWHDLSASQQQRAAAELLRSQESSGWLLAESHHSRYSLRSGQNHVLAAVHVVESWDISDLVLPPPRDTTWWRVEDRLLVPAPALLATAKQGVSRLVLLVHHRLGGLLGSEVHIPELVAPSNRSRMVNSRIIGALLEGHHVVSLPRPITVTFQHLQTDNVSSPMCVFWDYQLRCWSTEGCWLHHSNRSHTVCQCNHLTNLAIIMDITDTQDQPLTSDQVTLRMFVYIGCAVAMVFLLLTLLILQFVRCLRTERVTIHKHLCLCLLLAEAALVGGLDQTGEPRACSVLAGLLHYLLLAAFAWAFLDSFHLYILLGETGDSERWRLRWYCSVAYGVPLLVVAISAVIDPASYGTETYCWLRVENYYVFSFGGPAIACALAAILFLCLTVGRICVQRNSSIPVKSKDQTKLSTVNVWSGEATVLLMTLCSTWTLLPLFLHDERPLTAYLFLGLNILQGLLVFLFYCLNAGKYGGMSRQIRNFNSHIRSLQKLEKFKTWRNLQGRSGCARAYDNPHGGGVSTAQRPAAPTVWVPLRLPPPLHYPQYPQQKWTSLDPGDVDTLQCATPDRRCGGRNCEEHPLQYLLHPTDPPHQPWRQPDQRALCCYRRCQSSPQVQEPHYETLEPTEHEGRPILSSLAAVLSGSPCHVAYSGIQSPTDSDRSSSSLMDGRQSATPPSSPGNELTDSMPNLERRLEGTTLSASLTY